jgi:aspartate carbamoyltransferase regulatory subunit
VNYIKDGELKEKAKLSLPRDVSGILQCKNPRCITQQEEVESITFYLVDEKTKEYRCEYCDAKTSL